MKTLFFNPFILIISFSFITSAAHAAADSKKLERGKEIYLNNCVACHGVNGDGRGPAAAAIPGAKPRNFVEGKFKYGSTPEQLFKTVSEGVTGTAMPPWKTALPEDDRRAVIQYVLSLKAGA
jgi:cytochrome c oxidase cbb3-type subunit I/II